jgi:hypothetical protein
MKNIAEKGPTGRVQSITTPDVWPSEAEYGIRNVNQKHISKLMRDILSCIDSADGIIERGELVANPYDIGGRKYCGFYVDPCFGETKSRKYNRCYRRAQPAMTRALNKLEGRGLVQLVRHGRYIKKIELTAEGKMIVECLVRRKANLSTCERTNRQKETST